MFHLVKGDTLINYTLSDRDRESIKKVEKYREVEDIFRENGMNDPKDVQIEAFFLVEEYIKNHEKVKSDFNNGKTILFAFEGAGDYENPWEGNRGIYHQNGRFGALMVVIKNKEIVYMTPHGSTLPDNPQEIKYIAGKNRNVRTLDENVSNYYSNHHNYQYPGLRPVNKYQKVKSLEGTAYNGTSMNVHSSSRLEERNSEGCIIIRDTEYVKFGKKVGFMPLWVDDSIDNQVDIRKIGANNYVKDLGVTLVIDRSLLPYDIQKGFWK